MAYRGINTLQQLLIWMGRGLLGLYFVVPGLAKINDLAGTSEYMAAQGVPLIPLTLGATIVLQIGAGSSLMFGWRPQIMAFVLAGLTLLINLFMHDFWNVSDAVGQAHETQNFVKNLGIMAGLMFVAGTPGRSPGRQAAEEP